MGEWLHENRGTFKISRDTSPVSFLKSSRNGVGDCGWKEGEIGGIVGASMEAVVMEALGEDGFERLVAAFYRRVRADDLIGPMYPPEDWEGAQQRLADFLIFRFGGSQRYLLQRGHPRLRMRHFPFSIGEAERDRWLTLMTGAMDEVGLAGDARDLLGQFFVQVAEAMRNRPE